EFVTSRVVLAEALYPGSGVEVADALEAIASKSRRPRAPLGASAAWLIAYPDQFSAADRLPLAVLGSVLDSLQDVADGVHLLPMFTASSDGGFAVSDFTSVDDTYGDWSDIAVLADERSLMMDLVCNHTSTRHEWFDQFVHGHKPGWYRTVADGESVSDAARPRPGPPTIEFEGVSEAVWATFSADQVDLDYRNPAVLEAMTEVLFSLVDAGASAIRLDAVAYLWKSTTGTRLGEPNTHRIVALWRSLLDDFAPGVLLVAETNLPDDKNFAYFGAREQPEAHAVYQFSLPPLLLDALECAEASTLETWINELPSAGIFLNFLSSHDGVGLRAVEDRLGPDRIADMAQRVAAAGLGVNTYAAANGGERPYELAGTWLDLVAAQVGGADAASAHRAAYAVVYALSGIPLVYVHALCASHSDHAEANRSGMARDLNRKRLRSDEFLATFGGDGPAALMKQCCVEWRALRMHSAAFEPGSSQRADSLGPVLVIHRQHRDGKAALVAVNLGGERATVDVSSVTEFDSRWCDVDGIGLERIELGPYEDAWLYGQDG
ncbi:MAG: sugar phosphorylase, partial [Acidobacteria bacterium]|nr:sugar phosphorylase [Acidobacteriota bacterium]